MTNKTKLLVVSSVLALLFFKMFKITFGYGSHQIAFSAMSVAGPILGLLLSAWGIVASLGIASLIMFSIKGAVFMGFGLPTLAAAFCLRVSSIENKNLLTNACDIFLKVVLPISAMLLFVMHPVGYVAFAYSAYWLVPVAIFALERMGAISSKVGKYFATSLSGTFLAHAVGSVFYLYTLNTSSHMWISLIPVVAFERIILALTICSVALIIDFVATSSRVRLTSRI